MRAAKRHGIHMHERVFHEDGNRRAAGAHLDQRNTKRHLIGRKCRKGARKRRVKLAPDGEVAALDRELQILQRPQAHRDRMHRNAKPFAKHAAGIRYAARRIDHVTRRRRLDGLEALFLAAALGVGEQRAQMPVIDEGPGRRGLRARVEALGLAALHRKDHVLDTMVGQLLGCIDGFTDGLLGEVEIGHGPGTDAMGFMQGGAQHLDTAMFGASDDARDLGGAHIKSRNQPAARVNVACAIALPFVFVRNVSPIWADYPYACRSRGTGRESPLCNRNT